MAQAEEKRGDYAGADGEGEKRTLKSDVRHIHPPGDEHRRNVDRRGRHTENRADREKRAGRGSGQPHQQQNRSDDRAGRKHRGGGGTGHHAGEHYDDHQKHQHNRRHFVKPGDDHLGEGVEGPGLLYDGHKNHGRRNDQHGVKINEGAFKQVAQRDAVSGCESPCNRTGHHRKADRKLEQEIPQQKNTEHHKKNDTLDLHAITSLG